MKILLRVASQLRLLYWWLVRPVTQGIRAIVVSKEGKILLVRHKYGEGFFLPGGQSRRNEKSAETLRRELREEVGILEIQNETKLGEYLNNYEYKRDTITVFIVSNYTQKEKSHFEIAESGFFDPNFLPENTSPGTKRRIKEWLKQENITKEW